MSADVYLFGKLQPKDEVRPADLRAGEPSTPAPGIPSPGAGGFSPDRKPAHVVLQYAANLCVEAANDPTTSPDDRLSLMAAAAGCEAQIALSALKNVSTSVYGSVLPGRHSQRGNRR